jgi:plasmid stabilization system protein ParE
MNPRFILSPDARADLESAVRWYRRKNIDLSRRLRAQVAATFLAIARNPKSFVRVNNTFVRRALVARFPYSIYFRFIRNTVFVLRIRHQRRADINWKQHKNNWQADNE